MKIFWKKAALRTTLLGSLLVAITACTASQDPSGLAATGWVDSAMIPANANTDNLLVSNRGDVGN